MLDKFTNWKDFEKELNITPKQEVQIQKEMQIINKTIEESKSNLAF